MKKLLLLTALAFTVLLPSGQAAGIAVIGNLARLANIKPGDTFDGVILLKNPDAAPAEARVFQTDYLTDAAGRNEYGEPGSTPRSNAGWISVTPTRVKLAAGETVTVRYKGRAPADPKLRGTYWSMIMVEPVKAPAAAADHKQAAVGLQTMIRFGVQIVTELGREGTRSLQILDKCLVKEESRRFFHLDVGNNGERMLVPMIGLELFDSKGSSLGRFDGGRARIYPACSARSKIDLSDVPAGKYTAMVLLDSGGDQVMGAQYDLAIEP